MIEKTNQTNWLFPAFFNYSISIVQSSFSHAEHFNESRAHTIRNAFINSIIQLFSILRLFFFSFLFISQSNVAIKIFLLAILNLTATKSRMKLNYFFLSSHRHTFLIERYRYSVVSIKQHKMWINKNVKHIFVSLVHEPLDIDDLNCLHFITKLYVHDVWKRLHATGKCKFI